MRERRCERETKSGAVRTNVHTAADEQRAIERRRSNVSSAPPSSDVGQHTTSHAARDVDQLATQINVRRGSTRGADQRAARISARRGSARGERLLPSRFFAFFPPSPFLPLRLARARVASPPFVRNGLGSAQHAAAVLRAAHGVLFRQARGRQRTALGRTCVHAPTSQHAAVDGSHAPVRHEPPAASATAHRAASAKPSQRWIRSASASRLGHAPSRALTRGRRAHRARGARVTQARTLEPKKEPYLWQRGIALFLDGASPRRRRDRACTGPR